MILENQSLHLEIARLEAEVAGLKAERDAARAEIELARRILCLPLDQTEAEVKALEPGKTPMACRLLDLANLKSSHQAGVRLNRERRAEIERLTAENASLREAGRQVEAERDTLRKACEGLLKHAASKGFWERQSVDHWDKPGPHNAAVNALRVIAFAERALSAPTAQPAIGDTHPVSILYTNYRGETAVRRILPKSIRFAATEWHPEKQWLLEATDLSKNAERSFAIRDIRAWGLPDEEEGAES